MPIDYNDGGTWRRLDEIAYNDGGTYRTLDTIHYNDGGTWRLVHGPSGDLMITGATISDTGAGAEAGVALQRDGDLLHQRQNGSTDVITDEWILDGLKGAGVGDDYEMRCDVNSGILDGGISDTTGAWLDGAAQSQYSWNVSVNAGTGSANITVQMRDKLTETVQASGDFDISATV